MTVGELARLFDAEFLPDETDQALRVDVVRMRGWNRRQTYADTGLPWVLPTPNMPTPDTALVYPGTCMFEGTNLSEGRGTTRPFELIGAPYVDDRWATALRDQGHPGVQFREAYFTPTFSKHVNTACGGVQLHVTDPSTFDALRTATAMIVAAKKIYGSDFAWRSDNWIDKLTGSTRFRDDGRRRRDDRRGRRPRGRTSSPPSTPGDVSTCCTGRTAQPRDEAGGVGDLTGVTFLHVRSRGGRCDPVDP